VDGDAAVLQAHGQLAGLTGGEVQGRHGAATPDGPLGPLQRTQDHMGMDGCPSGTRLHTAALKLREGGRTVGFLRDQQHTRPGSWGLEANSP